MTKETYEQAAKLQKEMDDLMWLESLLTNASGAGRRLAAIGVNDDILNESKLTAEISDEMIRVVRAAFDIRCQKFEEL